MDKRKSQTLAYLVKYLLPSKVVLLGRIYSELIITNASPIKRSGMSLLKVLYNLKDELVKYKYTVLNMYKSLLNVQYNYKISSPNNVTYRIY